MEGFASILTDWHYYTLLQNRIVKTPQNNFLGQNATGLKTFINCKPVVE